MRILIHDFGRHAFVFQLSRELAVCGHEVHHLSFADDETPCASLQAAEDHPASLHIHALRLPYTYYKNHFVLRKIQLMHYGKILAEKVRQINPDIAMASTTPPDAQQYMQQQCEKQEIPFVFWLQDLFGLAVYNLLRQKHWALACVGRYYLQKEEKLLRRSDAVISISESFQEEMRNNHLLQDFNVIPNWGSLPCDDTLELNKDNPWSRQHGLHDQCVFMYSGTLGMKHDTKILFALADACESEQKMRLVIISEGGKMEKFRQYVEQKALTHTKLLPFQSEKDFPLALASADVTLAILSDDAARFSVPSKICNYMCSGSPTLISAKKENQAVQCLLQANAGIAVESGDIDAFITQAKVLLNDTELRQEMGRNARIYAQEHFDIQKISKQFLDIFTRLSG